MELSGIGEVTSIAAWGSESSEDNGFQVGEVYTWAIYNITNGEIVSMAAVTYSFGNDTYSCNGISGITSISIITSSCNDETAYNYYPSENDCDDLKLLKSPTMLAPRT